MSDKRTMTYRELELEIVSKIRIWRDEMIRDYGGGPIEDIDAGDAWKLASEIALDLRNGIEIPPDSYEEGKPVWESRGRLIDGWEK